MTHYNSLSGRVRVQLLSVAIILLATVAALPFLGRGSAQGPPLRNFDAQIVANASALIDEGRSAFRSDTFGDEAFWGGALQLHQAIKGAALGGVGPGIGLNTAFSLGLKVDVDALPQPVINQIKQG